MKQSFDLRALTEMKLSLLIFLLIPSQAHKVAIIGAGISGTFAAKYLADYDFECRIESITLFDPLPVHEPVKAGSVPNELIQGSRVASLETSDGSIVEIGASIGHKGFHHVIEMIRNDPSLEMGPPFNTGKQDENDVDLCNGLGVFNGDSWALLTSTTPSYLEDYQILYRYNVDLVTVSRLSQNAAARFSRIPDLLSSDHPSTFFESPQDIWNAVGLGNTIHISFAAFLEAAGIRDELSWWQRWLPYQGSVRKELLTAANLVNYNQNNSQVNAIVGLGSFAASSGGIFSIVGGNYKIMASALKQASSKRQEKCGRQDALRLERSQVTTVVGTGPGGLKLFSGSKALGEFDIVVLAVPLQHSRITFLVESHSDPAVLQPMPLAGLVNPEENPSNGGHNVLPESLPDAALRPYAQVITTAVSNATLNADLFDIPSSALPRSVLVTSAGKAALYNITGITQISSSGIYKVFSNEKLSESVLVELFGPWHNVEYVKEWGGKHGGATPDYRGDGEAPNFELYDGAKGFEGYSKAGAIFYTPAMEQSGLACMELSAIGAKAVAKLVAKRLALIQMEERPLHDEL